TGVDGVDVKLVSGIGGDEVGGQVLISVDVGGVDLHGHLGLVDGDGALHLAAGLVIGVALEGDADLLVLARAHLGIGAQVPVAQVIALTLNRSPAFNFGVDTAVKKDGLAEVLNDEVVGGQGALVGQLGGIPVDDV